MTQVHTPENTEKLAREFLRILLGWFKADGAYDDPYDELGRARVPVEALTRELVEDANDHFDANMAMHEAMVKLGLIDNGDEHDDCGFDDDTIDLFNAAWSRASDIASAARGSV